MAKNFNADFFVTCATVIPVLFLAAAVQGRLYESILRGSLTAAEARRGKPWWWREISLLLNFFAWCIVFFAVVGEIVALFSLYKRTDEGASSVLLATLVLLVAVAVIPLVAWFQNLVSGVSMQRRAWLGEGEAAEDGHGEAPRQADRPGADTD